MGLVKGEPTHELYVGAPNPEHTLHALNHALRIEMNKTMNNMVWTSWQINADTVAKPHTDEQCRGLSFITTVGPFSGGASQRPREDSRCEP